MSEIIETLAEETDICQYFAGCSEQSQYLISHPMNRNGVACCTPCFNLLVKLSDGKVNNEVIAERV